MSAHGTQTFTRRGLGWEAYGMAALLEGDLELDRLPTTYFSGKWELYDLGSDPGEWNYLVEKCGRWC